MLDPDSQKEMMEADRDAELVVYMPVHEFFVRDGIKFQVLHALLKRMGCFSDPGQMAVSINRFFNTNKAMLLLRVLTGESRVLSLELRPPLSVTTTSH